VGHGPLGRMPGAARRAEESRSPRPSSVTWYRARSTVMREATSRDGRGIDPASRMPRGCHSIHGCVPSVKQEIRDAISACAEDSPGRASASATRGGPEVTTEARCRRGGQSDKGGGREDREITRPRTRAGHRTALGRLSRTVKEDDIESVPGLVSPTRSNRRTPRTRGAIPA